MARKGLGNTTKRITPHSLRHTFASLHLARGTNLLWVQKQGGWTSPTVLLTVYAHFIPSELSGYADALTDGNQTATERVPMPEAGGTARKKRAPSRRSVVGPLGIEPRTGGLKVRCSTN